MARVFQSALNFIATGRRTSGDRTHDTGLGKQQSITRPRLKSYNSIALNTVTTEASNSFNIAIIQILWHNDVFRTSFLKFKGHACDGESCIFCALKVLFRHFQSSHNQAPLSNDVLSEALLKFHKITNTLRLERVEDVVESFEVILEHIHYSLTGDVNLDHCSKPWCAPHQKFIISTIEQKVCQCRAESVPLPYMEFVNNITISDLLSESKRLKSKFDQAVFNKSVFDLAVSTAGASGGDVRCPNFPICHKKAFTRRVLLNAPDMTATLPVKSANQHLLIGVGSSNDASFIASSVCIGFVWDFDNISHSSVRDVMETIGTDIKPRKLFDQVISDSIRDTEFSLNAMITYSEGHYSPFCYHARKETWLHFNDSNYKEIGSSWKNVVTECCKEEKLLQPLLLVFSNPNGVAVDTTMAPTKVIIAPPREEHSIATSPQRQTEWDTAIVSNTATQDVQSLLPVCPIEITELTMSISNPPSPIPTSTETTLSHSNPPSPIPPFNNTDHHPTVSSNPPSPLSATKCHTSSNLSSNPSTPSPATLKPIQSRKQNLSSKSDHLQVLSCTSLPRSPLANHSSLHPTKDSTRLFHTPTASPNSVSRPMPSPRRLRATQSMTELKQTPQPRSTARSQSLVPRQTTLLQQTTANKTQQICGQSNSHNAMLTLTRNVTSPLPLLPQCIDNDHFATKDTLSSLPATTVLKNMAVVNGPTTAANIPQYNSTRRSSSPFPSPDTRIPLQIIQTDSVPGLQYTAIDLGSTIKELPKHVYDALLHCGLCMVKINQSNDPVTTAILLDLAIGQIHGAMNQPSVLSCSELFVHLREKKFMLQQKFTSLMSTLNEARLDPSTLHSISSIEEIDIDRFFPDSR